MRKVSNFCDYFVICDAESGRQIKAIADAIVDELSKKGISVHTVEGDGESGWILVDTADVLTHIFSASARQFYDLERLWLDAKSVKLP